jgi:ABC-2 type transport system permease protein|uniref:Transport permease protein n=1 Tax=Anaerolinea thermolimosa TaxID=229919 RepID=A0A7C4PG34_9CHLR
MNETSSFDYDSSRRGLLALDELREVLRYRNLFYQFVRRDIVTRYKRSVLGVAWTMLNPLGMMLVLTIAFSQIFRFNTPNYPAYVLSGLLVWNFFAQTTTMSMTTLVWGGGLFKRIYMPRSIFALSSMGTGLVNLVLALVPMLLIMLVTGTPIRWTFLFLPVPILFLVMFALGVGLMLSTVAVYFPDVSEMYQIILTAWMYLTPIIYPATMLPERLRFWLEWFNPMYRIVQLFRLPLYDGRLPTWAEFWPTMILSLAFCVTGWMVFTRKSDEFAYRL